MTKYKGLVCRITRCAMRAGRIVAVTQRRQYRDLTVGEQRRAIYAHRTRRRIRVVSRCMLLMLLLVGCATAGRKIDMSAAAKIKSGETTKEEVVSLLGLPAQVQMLPTGDTMFMYVYTRIATKASTFIPVVGAFVGGADVQSQTLMVTLGADGVVKQVFGGLGDTGSGVSSGPTPPGWRAKGAVTKRRSSAYVVPDGPCKSQCRANFAQCIQGCGALSVADLEECAQGPCMSGADQCLAACPGASPRDQNTQPAPASANAEERLMQLDALHQKGLLTDEEYKQKRAAILNDL